MRIDRAISGLKTRIAAREPRDSTYNFVQYNNYIDINVLFGLMQENAQSVSAHIGLSSGRRRIAPTLLAIRHR